MFNKPRLLTSYVPRIMPNYLVLSMPYLVPKIALETICVSTTVIILKGGDPATGSPTATLLRLNPSHEAYRGGRSPLG